MPRREKIEGPLLKEERKENIMARYGKKSQETVKGAMRRMKKGKLKSGRSGRTVRNPKQAIAIGLSEARKKGAKVPPPPKGKTTSTSRTSKKK